MPLDPLICAGRGDSKHLREKVAFRIQALREMTTTQVHDLWRLTRHAVMPRSCDYLWELLGPVGCLTDARVHFGLHARMLWTL